MKTTLAVGAIILLVVGGLYLWMFPGSLSGLFGSSEPEVEVPVTPVDTRSTYASSTLGISLRYPQGWSASDYAYQFSSSKTIDGVKFTIPAQMATGTNLSPDSYVSVEWLPRATKCVGDIYLKANVKASPVTDGVVSYSLATSTEGAAGNFYEEWAYALSGSEPCTAVRYFIHSTNIGNYPAGAVREFDKAALIAEFDKIRKSLLLSR